MVQKHSARNLHWDFRLECDGVLLSWAVPKGPSPNPTDKRLAVRVEDHPLDYADFEGVIPEGEYGAGPVIVWDKGVWVPVEDGHAGLEAGKLLFELRGYKLRGLWTLVKTKQSEKSWLLIKERDRFVREEGTGHYPDDSIYSGLLVDELPDAEARFRALYGHLRELGARPGRVDARRVHIMLATARETPFSREGWLYEIKYDGYRVIAGRAGDDAVLISRSGGDFTATFPEVARAIRGLPCDGLVLDGEVVVHDERGLPSFGRLQKRGRLQREGEAERAALELPATFYAFDILGLGDFDLRSLPLFRRKDILRRVLPTVGPLRFSDHIETKGSEMYEQVCSLGLEGVVAKRSESRYRGGRSRSWLKIRALMTDDFTVVGWTEPKGSRSGLGALHLAQHDQKGELTYVGSVGTGFDESMLKTLHTRLVGLEREGPAFVGEVAGGPSRGARRHRWSDPEIVCEVRYREFTEQGLLRHPVFLRLRPDRTPQQCRLPAADPTATDDSSAAASEEASASGLAERAGSSSRSVRKEVSFTNLDKVFWPSAGHTKGDLIAYYGAVSEWLLPYLRDRPLVLTRYPDGIEGKSFFQKNAPEWTPRWITRLKLWSEDSEREIEYFVCNDLESLLYVANLGAIPLHIWSSRASSLSRPDWCILDLDPKDAPFENVVKIARHIRKLCDEIDLPAFAKTSGSTGLHVLIPLGRQVSYEQSRLLAELLARVVAAELPEIATIVRSPSRREGRVYVDFLQNGYGRLLVAPFSVRPVRGAAVSAPLKWTEVTRRLGARSHTIQTLPQRMSRLGEDPLAPLLDLRPDLLSALGRLTERLA